MSQTPTLVRIRIYPVKSLGGFDRDVWELDAFGLHYDRRWMIVDPDGQFMTQRDYPGMAEIAVEMQADRLILSVPMRSPISVPLEPEPGASEPVTIWGDTVAARAVSEDANRWLGEVLKTPCRLVYMPDESGRTVDREYVDHDAQVAFSDGFPLLLASEESLAELNRRLPEPVAMDRFRPNLVVRGVDGPHAEDTWRRIRLSDMEFRVVKPCARCVVVTTDQNTGQRGAEPLETLAGYRSANGEVYFGQNVVHLGHGRIRVGEDIQILETGDPVPDLDAADAGKGGKGGKGSGRARPAADRTEPPTGKAGHSPRLRKQAEEPTFELYLPESDEDLKFEPNLPPEPEREFGAGLDIEPGPELDAVDAGEEPSGDTEAETVEEETISGPGPDDIIFPFEVDLVVTPEDLKEAAIQGQAAADAGTETVEETVEAATAEEEPAEDGEAEEIGDEDVAVEEAIDEAPESVTEEAAEEEPGEPAVVEETPEEEAAEEPSADLEEGPAEEAEEEAEEEVEEEIEEEIEEEVQEEAEEEVQEEAEEEAEEEVEEEVEEEAEEEVEEEPSAESEAEPAADELEEEPPVGGKGHGKRAASGKAAVRDIEFVLGRRPDTSAINGLYEAAGRPEVAGDQDPGRIDRAFEASNVVVAAWLGQTLVGVLRGWSDGGRDGFISDLVVHPDHVGAGIGVELVHHAMNAHSGVRWVLRASVTSPYLGSALGWTHLGGGWFVSPA